MRIDFWSAKLQWFVCGLLLCACGGGGSTPASSGLGAAADPTTQELQCQSAGWAREVVTAAGLQRLVLWSGGKLLGRHYIPENREPAGL